MKIAFVGPESSGKTTLCEYLSKKHHAKMITEFARVYLAKKQLNYVFEDLEIIGLNQFQLIKNINPNELVFIDTDLIAMKVWSDFKYKKCCNFIIDNIPNQGIDFYFLCKPDIPWENDSLRENPLDREKLFKLFEKELIKHRFEYHTVKGNLESRLKFCQSIIDSKLR